MRSSISINYFQTAIPLRRQRQTGTYAFIHFHKLVPNGDTIASTTTDGDLRVHPLGTGTGQELKDDWKLTESKNQEGILHASHILSTSRVKEKLGKCEKDHQ